MQSLTTSQITEFQSTLLQYYDTHGRHNLPWRQPDKNRPLDPYKILVSELMLQQTQVSRVIPKFQSFCHEFPSFSVLASSPLSDVLRAWQGLGYNRRAKFLWQAAKQVMSECSGELPTTLEQLMHLPGVGKNTAGALLAYAYNQPSLFVETNIRTVYIYHFFRDQAVVHDKDILQLLSQTLDYTNPRQFYWSLMDYGSYLKKQVGGIHRVSSGYTKQSPFEGSRRQLRGQIIRTLSTRAYTEQELRVLLPDDRLTETLKTLEHENLIIYQEKQYKLLAE